MLGLLRDEIPDTLLELVRLELPLNLMRMSATQLATVLRGHMVEAGIHFHDGQPTGWTQAGKL
jgi:hypothetical protein